MSAVGDKNLLTKALSEKRSQAQILRLRGDFPPRTGRASETIDCGLINEFLEFLF
jgi:hypothetical protein